MHEDHRALLRSLRCRYVPVLGDVILDVYLRGTARGLCREAPVPVVSVSVTERVPGGAANAAASVVGLGGRSAVIGAVGTDAAGSDLHAVLRTVGVPSPGPVSAAARATIVKRRVVAGPQLVLRMDEGAVGPLDPRTESALLRSLDAALAGADALLVSDAGYGTVTPGVHDLLASRRTELPVLVVDARDPLEYAHLRPTAITPNYAETTAMLGLPVLDDGEARLDQVRANGSELVEAAGTALVVATMGGSGVLVLRRGRSAVHVPAVVDAGCDVIGAGDVFAAALTLALAAGAEPVVAAEFATRAAVGAAMAAAAEVSTAVGSALRMGPPVPGPVPARGSASAVVLTIEQLPDWAAEVRRSGRRIVFTNGCFDLLHEGHVRFLHEARALGDVLVVAVNDDASVRDLKGGDRPVVDLEGRLCLLAALGPVDHVVPFSGRSPMDLIRAVRPDVFAKGGDYEGASLTEADALGEVGAEVRVLGFVEGRSTTRIVDRLRAGHR